MTVKPGDIVEIFFPFAEGEDARKNLQGKERPTLVMTAPDADGNFVAAAITGTSHHPNTVAIRPQDLLRSRMRKASFVRADKLFSFNGPAVIQNLGTVTPAFLVLVHKAMCTGLGCGK